MRKHIFTLGLLLSSFCIMPTMADDWVWNGGVVEASNVFYDEDLEIPAKMHCATCCSSKEGNNITRLEYDPNTGRDKIDPSTRKGGNCWLPRLSSGKYYLRASDTGQVKAKQAFEITQDCVSPERFSYYQVCIPNKTYSSYNSARCRADCNRDNGLYDIGIDVCVDKDWRGYLPPGSNQQYLAWQVRMWRQSTPSSSGYPENPFILKGVATCANDTDTYLSSLNEGVGSGNYCFCRMTSVYFTDATGTNIEHGSKFTGWVSVKDYRTNPGGCGISCAKDCANAVSNDATVREKMYQNYDR